MTNTETASANYEPIDLTQYDDAYAEAPIEERGATVPDGTYQVTVDKVELTRSQAGNPLLKWQLCILNGAHKGRMIFRNNMIMSADNLRFLKTDLHIAGLDIDKVSELPNRLGDLLDVALQVTVKTKGDNTNVYLNSRIAGVGADGDPGPGDADALGAF